MYEAHTEKREYSCSIDNLNEHVLTVFQSFDISVLHYFVITLKDCTETLISNFNYCLLHFPSIYNIV